METLIKRLANELEYWIDRIKEGDYEESAIIDAEELIKEVREQQLKSESSKSLIPVVSFSVCPKCGSEEISYLINYKRFACSYCYNEWQTGS